MVSWINLVSLRGCDACNGHFQWAWIAPHAVLRDCLPHRLSFTISESVHFPKLQQHPSKSAATNLRQWDLPSYPWVVWKLLSHASWTMRPFAVREIPQFPRFMQPSPDWTFMAINPHRKYGRLPLGPRLMYFHCYNSSARSMPGISCKSNISTS
jgi:hypothetical protein